ncbi:cadherin-like beta sandwich domain-containing protein [Haloferula sp.]|uniref:cadherin-like beta sandwich domain-containing protein n=1 Tax=Haloferula sp. TaxID=2497595 RepID=UPI00329F92BB
MNFHRISFRDQSKASSRSLFDWILHAASAFALSLLPLSAAPFSSGNLVIYRVGDGTGSLTNTGNPVFLDEYLPNGSLVQSIPMPTVPSGFSRRLVASGTSTAEGLLTRSADGRFLVATGYDATIPYVSSLPGTASNTVFRTIGRVDSSGNVDTTTFLQDYANGGSPRSAVTHDGSGFWVTGSTGGVRFAPFGATNNSTPLLVGHNNLRQAAIFDDQLFVSSGSAATARITSVGSGLPIAGPQTLTPLPDLPASGLTFGFQFVDLDPFTPGNDTLYLADEGAGLQKFSLVEGSWTNNGSIGNSADDYRGLTATVSGNSVTLHAIRKTQGAAGGGELVEFTDFSGFDGTFGGVPTLLASASANTAFRGIAPTPFVGPDLVVSLDAPETAATGDAFDYIFKVSNVGNADSGRFQSEFHFTADLSPLSFSSSEGVPDVDSGATFNSATLDLPDGLAPGGSVSMTVTVESSDPGTFSVSPEETFVDSLAEVAEVNESNNLIEQEPITVVSDPDGPMITVHSIEFDEVENGDTMDFGVQVLGFPEAVNAIIITNSGLEDLEIQDLTIFGPHELDFDAQVPETLPTLGPFDDLLVPITFQANAEGIRSATLSIETNDPGESPFIVNLTGNGIRQIILGENSLFNGNAESGPGGAIASTILPAPGWSTTGVATVSTYGVSSFPSATSPGPIDRGTNFFSGGPNGSQSSFTQKVGLSSIIGPVNTGTIGFALSGYLGGLTNQNDRCTITADFLASDDSVITSETLGPVTNTERGNLTGLIFRSVSGSVPTTAHAVIITQTFTRSNGARNDGYSDNLKLTFFAPSAPIINTQPTGSMIASGASTTLTVEASGGPPPTFQWYSGTSGDTSNPILDAIESSFTTPSLTTTTNYWVRASNPSGSDDSATATIVITGASSNSNLADLEVSDGFLSPAFAPLAENYDLDLPNSVSSITLTPTLADENASLEINGSGFPSGLETSPFPLSAGLNIITLVVTAEDGTTTRTYTINAIRDEPQLVITEPAGAISPSGAQLNATINPRGGAVAYFQYGTSASYGSVTAGQVVFGDTSQAVSANLSGINGGTEYHFRVILVGENGMIAGNDASFVTGVQLPVAATGNPVAVSETGATLVGAVSSNGLPVDVHFEYGLTTLYGSSTSVQNFPAGTSLTDVLAPITGLISGADYHYRIVANSAAGTIFGRDVTFEATAGTGTGTGTPTSTPDVTTGGTADIDTFSAELLGDVNANDGTTVVQFEFGTTTNYGRVSEVLGIGNGNEIAAVSLPASGLLPGTLYHYRLAATNSLGTTVGADATFTTLFQQPVVSTGAATGLSTTSASIEGSVRARNATAQVFVDYGTNISSLSNSVVATPSLVLGDTNTPVSALLPDLVQGTTYYYQVRAENSGGTGKGSIKTFDVGVLSGLFQQFPDAITAADHQGSATVELTPGGIGNGWRFAGEQAWRNSGDTASGLASGDRVIEYRPVPGYVQPSDETVVVISEGTPLAIDRTYTATAEMGSGGLTVSLKPQSLADSGIPVANRAQWRFFGESDTDWKDSGTTISSLVSGDYVIECKPVAGRTTPPAVSASVADSSTTSTTITYYITEDPVGTPPSALTFDMVSTREDRPYAYVGQITSDIGASTGFVVRPRVVATAGHVVFDDGTLSSTTGVQWLFERDQGVHEPAPQVPRGYYLLSGYSAQRATDNTPGTSTPESQNLDAAALYFSNDSGRAGFSGFLASDSTVNEFVVSSALMTLVGYPVDGIAPENQGRAHATPINNITFASAFGQTYTTSGIRSSGGNSGGPLCVQASSGIYYPAAIYLGGTAQTVVRAIDGSIVDLFGFAESSAEAAVGATGGSITQSGTSAIGTPTLGAIMVNIEPAEARAAGAGWRIQAQADYSASGSQITDLSPNDYTVQFASVSGFVPPTPQSLTIQGGQLTTITFTYEEIISPPTITSPNTQTVVRGQSVLYEITATNNPTLFSQLGALPAGTFFEAATGIISGPTQEAGNFPITIGASNSGGADTRVVNLTVRPVLEAQSTALPYLVEASYQIVSSESGEGVSYASDSLPDGLSLDNATGLITGTPTAPGVYPVPISVTRNGATSTAELTLNITGNAPVITQQPPATKSVEFGLSTTLNVVATGLPEPDYQWYDGLTGDTSNPVAGATNATFTTPPVTTNTSYWVRVSSISGSADSSATAITVLLSSNPKLSFLAPSESGLSPAFNAGIFDYSITLPYGVDAISLIPTVQVSQSTVEIAGTPVASDSPSGILPLNVGLNTIPILVTAGDGITTQEYTVLVTRAQPPVVTTSAATLVTDISATLNGTVIPNSPVGIVFEYGLTTDYGNTSFPQSAVGLEELDVEASIVGLTGSTTYHYRIVAVTAAGLFVGNDMTFTTNLARPLAATGSPAGVDTTQATLIGAIDTRDLATDAYFEYGTTPSLGTVTPTQNLPAGSGVVDVIEMITGLTPSGTYYYRVVASNIAGTSFGDIVDFQAISGGGSGDGIVDAPPTVTTGSAVDIMIDSAVLQGVVNPNDGTTFVHFEYGLTTGYGSTTVSEGIGNGTENANVTLDVLGLTPGVPYHYRLVATNSLGTVVGSDATFVTEYFPPIATTGEATALSSTSATVAGTIQALGDSAEAWFDYGTDGVTFPNSIRATPQTVAADNEALVSVDLTNLDGAETYYYRIRGEGSGGTGLGDPVELQVGALLGFEQEFTRVVPSGDHDGELVVNLLPESVGGWRFVGESQWRPTGVPVGGMTSGEREIEFQPVTDYIQPQRELVGVVSGEAPLALDRIYYESDADGTGTLRVILEPSELAGAGVPEANRLQWRLVDGDDPTWLNSTDEITTLLGGSYLIECKAVPGKNTPTPSNHLVIDGETTTATITYFPASAPLFNPPTVVPFSTVSSNEDLPYAYVGQVRGGTGSHSGFAVKPRVVATVAQAVFDDATLAVTNNTQWLLQRDRGSYEPEPQTPRGFYIFTGYDAQRASEDTPGTLTVESMDLNVAALYFAEDAGRGGFSGFLASDEADNEFLQSDDMKILAGYPVNGIASNNQGRLHATSASAASFSQSFGRTFTSPSIRGIGGMTGGPLCVQYEGGSYYPAGIYVGGTSVGTVRAIDAEVIEIFTRAEISANGGDNQTGGGITHSSFASIGDDNDPSALQVTIEPELARNAGAGWRLIPENFFRPSGNQKAGLTAGTYKLEFIAIEGFDVPVEQSVDLAGGQLKQIVYTYQEGNTAPMISDIDDQNVPVNSPPQSVDFNIDDAELSADSLILSKNSSDEGLITAANVVLSGADSDRTVTITPQPNLLGSSTITLNVDDGNLITEMSFSFTVTGTALETWRFENFGTTENVGDAADDADPDGDGATNIEENMAGTDPNDPSDVFRITSTSLVGTLFTVTAENGKTDRTYILQRAESLAGPWPEVETIGPLNNDGPVSLEDNAAPPIKAYYRIEVLGP